VREASRVVGLYHDGCQVGFSRVLSDGAIFAYLADVYVLEEHRGDGRGTELVRWTIEEGGLRDCRWMLHTHDAHRLYEKLGFEKPDHKYMERPRP
jgi:GNAT superfamily N-acetyltransferase